MLDYFQEKLMTKLFKKYKKPYFVAILVVFCPNLGKNEFSWEKVSLVFKHSNYLHLRKIRKKNYCAIPEENNELTDG